VNQSRGGPHKRLLLVWGFRAADRISVALPTFARTSCGIILSPLIRKKKEPRMSGPPAFSLHQTGTLLVPELRFFLAIEVNGQLCLVLFGKPEPERLDHPQQPKSTFRPPQEHGLTIFPGNHSLR
jgi:hypothetical protein